MQQALIETTAKLILFLFYLKAFKQTKCDIRPT